MSWDGISCRRVWDKNSPTSVRYFISAHWCVGFFFTCPLFMVGKQVKNRLILILLIEITTPRMSLFSVCSQALKKYLGIKDCSADQSITLTIKNQIHIAILCSFILSSIVNLILKLILPCWDQLYHFRNTVRPMLYKWKSINSWLVSPWSYMYSVNGPPMLNLDISGCCPSIKAFWEIRHEIFSSATMRKLHISNSQYNSVIGKSTRPAP